MEHLWFFDRPQNQSDNCLAPAQLLRPTEICLELHQLHKRLAVNNNNNNNKHTQPFGESCQPLEFAAQVWGHCFQMLNSFKARLNTTWFHVLHPQAVRVVLQPKYTSAIHTSCAVGKHCPPKNYIHPVQCENTVHKDHFNDERMKQWQGILALVYI